MLNMGPWDGLVGTRYSPPTTHPATHTPGTPATARRDWLAQGHGSARGLNMAVGLISVDQLSLGTDFSDIRGMTEGYNLVGIGNR